MKKFYVTFGQKYRREEHPVLGMDPRLPDGYLLVEAQDYEEARAQVVSSLYQSWSGLYDVLDDGSDGRDYYPLGCLGLLEDALGGAA